MKPRYVFLVPFAVLGALPAPGVSFAAWSAEPVTVQATSDRCPLVAVATDVQQGGIVVWQQLDTANPPHSRLLARRLLANGDLDPSWPAGGLMVSDETLVEHEALGAIGDGLGGAYVWWMESSALFVSRVLATGAIAPGWPARGRGLGSLSSSAFRPQVLADGAGGLWLGWFSGTLLSSAGNLIHLGPDNTGAGGWGEDPAQYAVSRPNPTGRQTLAFGFGPTADGGAWIVWGDATPGVTGWQAGSWRLSRVDAVGDISPGWTVNGVVLAPFHAEFLGADPYYAGTLAAVATDGGSGSYVLLSDVVEGWFTPRLSRRDATGAPAAGWPAGGIDLGYSGPAYAVDPGADGSARLYAQTGGGVLAVRPVSYTHQAGASVRVHRVTDAAAQSDWGGGGGLGIELSVQPTGEALVAACWPDGPLGPYAPPAYVALDQTLATGGKGPGFIEFHDEPALSWYDDVGVAPMPGGGAIFAWSQHNQRFGVFARRFSATGEVTGAPAGGSRVAMRLRFAPGRGVVASLGRVAGGRIDLLDVTGRSLAGADVPAGAREVVLAGSSSLAPGLYFARHRAAKGEIETGKVAVVR